jgi:hypothetical protein
MEKREKELDVFVIYRHCAEFVHRRWLVLVIVGIIGGAFGFFKAWIGGNSFETDIIISSEIIPKDNLYSKIYPVVIDKDGEIDASMLKEFFNEESLIFKSVKEIKVDTSSLKNSILLSVSLSNTDNLNKIVSVFKNYYEEQEDYEAVFIAEKGSTKRFLDLLNKEIDELNEFQQKVLDGKYSIRGGSVSYNMTGSHEELVALFEKQIEMEQIMKISQPVNVSVNKFVVEVPPSYLRSIVIWGVVFGFLCLIVLFFVELDRSSKKQ